MKHLRQLSILSLFSLTLFAATPNEPARRAAVSWTGGGDGTTWNQAANWSSNPALPGATDDVTIDLAGNNVINLSGVAATINSLALSGTNTLNLSTTLSIAAASSIGADAILNWTSSTINGGGTLTNLGQITLTTGGNKTLGAATTIDNDGTVSLMGGGDLLINGSSELQNDGMLNFLDDLSNLDVTSGTGTLTNTATGQVIKSGGAGITTLDVTTTNAGTINAASGTLNFTRSLDNQAGGTIKGIATVDVPLPTNFSNTGATAPGASPGILSVTGDYLMEAGSMFNVELNGLTPGTEHDQLQISANADLTGTINVTLGFSPVIGDMFVIATTGGTLNTCVFPAPSATFGGMIFDFLVNCNASDITLQVSNALPVELVSFEALVTAPNVVRLTWETATETQNAGFEVEHARINAAHDMQVWQPLGFVEGHGTTTEAHTYTYEVGDLLLGPHHFRLKQLDFDGQFEYSPEIEVFIELPGTHLLGSAYPNPFNPTTRFTLMVANRQDVRIDLYDAVGRLVETLFSGQVEAHTEQVYSINGHGLPSGLYLIRVTGVYFSESRAVTLLK